VVQHLQHNPKDVYLLVAERQLRTDVPSLTQTQDVVIWGICEEKTRAKAKDKKETA
jgi:hypothetical protein